MRKRLTRNKVLPFFANLKPCLIGIEAQGSSNYWAREIIKLGHEANRFKLKEVSFQGLLLRFH